MPILQWTTPNNKRMTINVRRESTVVMENERLSYTFDYEGRLVGAFVNGRNYRRSLDNEILEKASGEYPGLSGRVRRFLSRAEARAFEEGTYDYTRALTNVLTDAALGMDAQNLYAVEQAREALARIDRYNFDRLEIERDAFRRIYKPVTILPPDQYLALYLQATEGCSFNSCTFCGFYHDRHFRVKSLNEFHDHLRRVRGFFGGSLALRQSIFIGDANALLIPQAALVPMLDAINSEFAILPRGLEPAEREAWQAAHPIHFHGIYSFIDAFSTKRKTSDEFRALAERGLRRVYVGLETGDAELLHFLSKPNTPAEVVELANHVKAGGVAIGIIVLVGAGGDKFAEAHVRNTARIVNAMPLDENDVIYFSELVDFAASAYSLKTRAAGIRPLTFEEIAHQMAQLRAGFDFPNATRTPHVSYYDIREFVY